MSLNQLRRMGDILEPADAEEPILSGAVRGAVRGWMSEMAAADDLAAYGLKPRTSALLYGPPGCGKTTLAHHIGARMGLPILCVGAEHIESKYVGEAEKNVRGLFDAVEKANGQIILFIDEIDAIGGKRSDAGSDRDGAVSSRNSTLTVLLRQVERLRTPLIAATNRRDSLDPALVRRFGLRLSVDLPDADASFAILRRYALPLDLLDAVIDTLAQACSGAAPYLLRQLMEGLKRRLALCDRLGQHDATMADAIVQVAAEIEPGGDEYRPMLWDSPVATLRKLSAMPWPPALVGAEASRHPGSL